MRKDSVPVYPLAGVIGYYLHRLSETHPIFFPYHAKNVSWVVAKTVLTPALATAVVVHGEGGVCVAIVVALRTRTTSPTLAVELSAVPLCQEGPSVNTVFQLTGPFLQNCQTEVSHQKGLVWLWQQLFGAFPGLFCISVS